MSNNITLTRVEYWRAISARNPSFNGDADDTVTLTVRGLKKLFDQAWEAGNEEGVRQGRAIEKLQNMSNKKDDSLFDDLDGLSEDAKKLYDNLFSGMFKDKDRKGLF